MAEVPTLIQEEDDEVREGVQNWVMTPWKDEGEKKELDSDVRTEPDNGRGRETRHGARNQSERGRHDRTG